MLSDSQKQAFAAFHAAVEGDGALDARERHMVRLAAAVALGCYP
ncbi:MAG: carboxymuconolactone decarboxylase family protein [Thermodesulfobacteriota bacterium]